MLEGGIWKELKEKSRYNVLNVHIFLSYQIVTWNAKKKKKGISTLAAVHLYKSQPIQQK